eukprot:Nitzschia sp. Nitz4//scaffold19_size178191//153658//156897//NITZ4_002009-RA/size178191-processed-gene-0.88-mRNA-1//-1//CDS//3329540777//2560//frame0
MSSMPAPPPMRSRRSTSTSSGSTYQPSPSSTPPTASHVRASSVGGLPPPPTISKGGSSTANSGYAQNLAKSMTIDEMRELHRRALSDAEAKQTELRLVLASRYRELVGSSDEVTKMRERAQELHELVHALPDLMTKLLQSTSPKSLQDLQSAVEEVEPSPETDSQRTLLLRQQLSNLPRLVHRALDTNDVHEAASSLMKLFCLIAQQTDEYPLATALASSVDPSTSPVPMQDELLRAQMRMTYLHVQTLPSKITRISKDILQAAASYGPDANLDPKWGAYQSASALSTLDVLDISPNRDRPVQLLDMYFDAKATLLQDLLNDLNAANPADQDANTEQSEDILSKIVLILQYDIILHPYQIFVLRQFPTPPSALSTDQAIMTSLPIFPAEVVQTKVSKFLAAHLPLIRTKVKTVLVAIAGTTASALGKIRQSLFDKTDGVECVQRLDSNGVCTWNEAVGTVVDVPNVLSSSFGAGNPMAVTGTDAAVDRKFSLWSVLFSNTFSSLVHSLLTTSFHSVHTRVVSTLRLSLANAPSLSAILPHEAYRNTLCIATDLNAALLKVSEDAHELLVHAEDRVESETRLRLSLYVQTCEIMGRLICELRRMLLSNTEDAVKDLIVGRLCHLLKFRLTALPTLLDSKSSPAVLQGSSGMISLMELSSAFELADDNEDGIITFNEAIEAVDSAFSGTQFHGAEMVRETLLLPTATTDTADRTGPVSGVMLSSVTPEDVTLNELTLLLARGLRHDSTGRQSALGAIQESLDQIISTCFDRWATEALRPHSETLGSHVSHMVQTAATYSEEEYKRVYAPTVDPATLVTTKGAAVGNVSPHILDFLLEISFALNRSVCPSDSLPPVPSAEYAKSVGNETEEIPCLIDLIRWALLAQGSKVLVGVLSQHISKAMGTSEPSLKRCGPSGLVQLKTDLSFVGKSFFRRNQYGFGRYDSKETETTLRKVSKDVDTLVRKSCDKSVLGLIEENHGHIMEVCDLYVSSLLGPGEKATLALGDAGSGAPRMSSNPLLHTPLTSSCRFPLLPIQADRTLSGVQARGKYKEKDQVEAPHQSVSSGAMRAGLGLFSSLLKTG